MNFKKIPKKYRPIPFWSWNEKLEPVETAEQVRVMDKAGIGGFFMHARGGLQTEYMSEEWFENVEAAVSEAEKLGMRPWAYDENGWPSGFGSGLVNGLGVAFQQKYLRMEEMPEHKDTQICKSGNHYFYYDVNPFYVDTLDKKVIKEFIDKIYEPYYARFGNRVEGFFTDEPQISRNGIPWSFVMPVEYEKRYQDDLLKHLEELFLPVGDYKATRVRFWKMVTDLFSESYMKQIYDWCEDHGMKLTGHLVLEGTPLAQLVSNGAIMPHYEYFHIPGMDWLGRPIKDWFTARQVASVAEQTGKEAVLSETFACCGHNVSFAELKGIYESQMVRGINLLCQHLEGYSLRGLRKRDYPPAMYFQQPWWSEYDKWNEAMSRESMILAESSMEPEVLLLHPQTTAWTMYDDTHKEVFDAFHDEFKMAVEELERKHILFHLGDETMMERHGRVEGGKLVIGAKSYKYVIKELCRVLLPHTEKLLEEFSAQGGQIISMKELEANPVIDAEEITYTCRMLEGQKVHFFVNSSDKAMETKVYVKGKKLDIYSGELECFDGAHRFEPWGSLMILENSGDCAEKDDDARKIANSDKKASGITNTDENGGENAVKIAESDFVKEVHLNGTFAVAEDTLNVLTLDKCDYYFDGELQEQNGYVINIAQRANALERKVHIRQEYHVMVKEAPSVLYMAVETPEIFKITINGIETDKTEVGYFRDKSFRKIDIARYINAGQNSITFECDFVQSEAVYENIRKAWNFESEKNKLTYDMEIEPIYLVGSFGVRTDGTWSYLDRSEEVHFQNAWRYSGDFVLDAPVKNITLENIEKQGFPFFSGELTLFGTLEVPEGPAELVLDLKGVNAIRIACGDFKQTILTEDRISLEGVSAGRHELKLTLINNLRNMMGPHHLDLGEFISVGPTTFYEETCVWRQQKSENRLIKWNKDYCFVCFGREGKQPSGE